MSLIISPKMASKRPSAADTVFPPKKRALYEHMKLHGIEKYSSNRIAANGIVDYQENLGMCGFKLPVNIVIAESENFSRTRSDSLNSHVSSNSDNTETGSTGSRETSPCTIQSMFDHQTPERNPISSLDGLKPDISKPLFPPSDSDSSIVGSEGQISPDNSITDEHDNSKADVYGSEKHIPSEQVVDYKNLQRKQTVVNEFRNNEVRQEEIEHNHAGNSVKQAQSEVYMGPMVSLLNRFNAEAVQNKIHLKIKEQLSLDELRNVMPSNLPIRHYDQSKISSLNLMPESVPSKILTEKLYKNKVQSKTRSCHVCNKEFSTVASLHTHMKGHENKSIPCWVCKEKFQSAESLNAHMKSEHKGENPYKCEHCSREFTQFNNLRRHMRVHREKVFKCNLCNREFNEEFYLKMHMGTHTGKRVYSCGVCGAGFPSSHDLKVHVKTHSPSLLHTCDVCGKSFSKACVLRQHKKGHSGERPHKCDKCEKTFIHRHHLTMHMKSHVDEKRLSCNICQKEFSQHSHLYKHLRAHEDMKKYGLDLNPTHKMKNVEVESNPKKDVSQGQQISQRSSPKVVTTDNVSCNESEGKNKHSIDKLNNTTSKTPKQRKHSVNHDYQYQNSGNVSEPLLAPPLRNNHALPSMAQSFTHQMGSRLPSMQFSGEMSRNYHPGSPAQSFSPLFNPLLRNGAPAMLHGYQSYNQMYRNYSEQMQSYYNHVYMMQYMSQNTLLQKDHVENHNFRNEQKFGFMKPKIIQGVESLENEQKFHENKGKELDDVNVQSDSDDNNSEVDVVNAVNELSQDEQELYTETNDIGVKQVNVEDNVKQGNIMSEEHEIAQELLKMSAGTKQTEQFVEDNISNTDSKSAKEVNMKKDNGHATGLNFSHCVNDIIKRTVRNSKFSFENTYMSKLPNIAANDVTPLHNESMLRGELSVVIPKSSDLLDKRERNNFEDMSVQGETIASVESGLAGEKVNSESQASPLQKLEMFVTSEKNDFNKVEAIVNDSRDPGHNFHGYFTEEFEKLEHDTYTEEKLESDYLETSEKFEMLLKEKNQVKEFQKQSVIIEETLEMRLKKIKQFADIGMKFGNTLNDAFERKAAEEEIDENKSLENITYDKRVTENDNVELSERKVVRVNVSSEIDEAGTERRVDMCDNDDTDNFNDVSGYFNDSLEDRQLHIVENDSFRGKEIEDIKESNVNDDDDDNEDEDDDDDGREGDQGQMVEDSVEGKEIECTKQIIADDEDNDDDHDDDSNKGDEEQIFRFKEMEESKDKLNEPNEEFIFTENEFLNHISEMNGSSKANKEDRVEIVDEYKEEKDEEKIVGFENGKGSVQTMTKQLWEENLKHGNDLIHQLKELQSDPNELKFREKCFNSNRSENEAMDLRTEGRMNKISESKVCEVNSVQNISQENLPMDLSLSRRWSDDTGQQIARGGEFKVDGKYAGNSENRSPMLLTCGLCSREFDDIHQLRSHQIEHAKDIGYSCKVCKKFFTSAFELQCHMIKHSEIPVESQIDPGVSNGLKCVGKSVLGASVQSDRENQDLTLSEVSQMNENGEKQFSCKYCDKIFVREEQLTEHVNVHYGSKKPYVCNICRRAFVHRHNLNRHKMSHNSKSYKCDVCHRTFKESFYLQMHKKTHEEENYRKCQICGENVHKLEIWQHTHQHLGTITENPTYKQIGNMVQEILHEQDLNKGGAAQKNDVTRIPPKISNVSEYGDNLRQTMSNVFCLNDRVLNFSKENIENCNVTKNVNTDIKHANVLQNKENLWDNSSILSKNRFEEGSRNSSGKMFQMFECHICKVVLSTKHELDNHMGIHSGLRPHVCKLCGRAFKKSKGLKTHEKIHLESSFKV